MILYHVTTPKFAKKYREQGSINKPVRGFTTPIAAMAWAMRVKRTVIYEVRAPKEVAYKLPDHHNEFGEAWWFDKNVVDFKCFYSAGKDDYER